MINPFNPAEANGVCSYYESLRSVASEAYEFSTLSNTRNQTPEAFRETVLAHVSNHFAKNEVVIEAPETRAATLLLTRDYRVHIRLHTPLGICQKYEHQKVHQPRLSDELRVIAQAAAVSAPSYSIVEEVGIHLDTAGFIVNKNPISIAPRRVEKRLRRYDLVFLGRNQPLKGVAYVKALLPLLPRSYRVALAGKDIGKLSELQEPELEVAAFDHISGDAKLDLLSNAKVVLVPSVYENCSMVILEAIACGAEVVAWHVGGNSEFPPELVHTVPFDRLDQLLHVVRDVVERTDPDPSRADECTSRINADFSAGLAAAVRRANGDVSAPYRSPFCASSRREIHAAPLPIRDAEHVLKGRKVFGFTISNEHIEEMWTPLLHYLGLSYRFVCRRPLGFHSKFAEKFPVDPARISQYDWIAETDRMIAEILEFAPDVILTHNGSHPQYRLAMAKVRALGIPLLFTELGWFPQGGHVYVDRDGVNAASSIAKATFFELTGKALSPAADRRVKSEDIFLPAQLNNDVNVKVFSPRFVNVDDFVRYVVEQVGGERRIFLKPHPLDPQAERFLEFGSPRLELVDKSVPASDMLQRVGHVVALNSTVLLEALNYDVNIYSGGRSILDNKGIAFDLTRHDLKDVLTERLCGSPADRAQLVAALKKRQIHVSSLIGRSAIDEGELEFGLRPFAEALLVSSPRLPAVARPDSLKPSTVAGPVTVVPKRASAAATMPPDGSDIKLPLDLCPLLRLGPRSVRRHDGLIQIGKGAEGHGVYGPYTKVRPGAYEVTIAIKAEARKWDLLGSKGVAVLDVVVDEGRTVLAEKRLPLGVALKQEATQKLGFTVPPRSGETPVEFRIWTDGKAILTLHQAVLRGVEATG